MSSISYVAHMDTPSNSTDTMSDYKMKVFYNGNEPPSGEIFEILRNLWSHSKSKRYAVLAAFFDEVACVLREEVEKLPRALSALVPHFESVIDLGGNTELRKGPLRESIDGALLCMFQIGTFIGHFESKRENVHYDLSPNDTYLAGLGVGMFSAAAVSLAAALPDIVVSGSEAVRVAFRLGVHVDAISRHLESQSPDAAPGSWAYVITEVPEEAVQQELDRLNRSMLIPAPCKIFISGSGKDWCTISGPPSRLSKLVRSSELLRYSKWSPLPVYGGLCHAPHVYSAEDARAVLEGSRLTENVGEHIPLLSSVTGKKLDAANGAELFELVVFELLTGRTGWDYMVATLESQVSLGGIAQLEVFSSVPSKALEDLKATIESSAQEVEVSLKDTASWLSDKTSNPQVPRSSMQSKIAIVGMSCRFPGGANSLEEFWSLLEQGLDVHQRIPADRFDVDTHCDPSGKARNASRTPYGCFVDKPGMFDAGFFNMSPREAEQTDPMHRLALVTAHEALEMAGFVPNRTPSSNLKRVGVFYGQSSDDYREVNAGQEISTYYIPGGCRAFACGRINYFYKFGGPSFNCDTACSSSLATIQIACTSIWSGDADMIIAGGLNMLTNSDGFAGLSNGHFLSGTGNCKTWDCNADGYCRADGVGSIILKRLEDAEADNDNILGVIVSAATNHSCDAVSITHPHAGAQSELYTRVMSRAGVDPLDVSYVEFHGTGTQAGDSTEVESVTNVFAPLNGRRRPDNPLHVGSVKSNVGHGEAAAGVMAMIKTAMMLQKESIPRHVGIKTGINPVVEKFFDKKRNVHIPYEQIVWPRSKERKRLAVVNNFSAAGGNTTVLLEEAPLREVPGIDKRQVHVVTLSAKSKISLKGNIEKMVEYLEKNPVSLSDLAYTTCARRIHHNHRVTLAAANIAQLKKELLISQQSAEQIRPVATTPPTIAFVFGGQGVFYGNIANQLFRDAPSFREEILLLDSLCKMHGFPSIVPAINNTVLDIDLPPITSHLTIVCIEIALAAYWSSLGISPSSVIGSSLGEYAALHVAGVLSASDTIFLAGKRAQELQKACKIGSHIMLTVRASKKDIESTLAGMPYEIACINGPSDTVIDGPQDIMTHARKALEAAGYKCLKLEIPYAFHSSQMDPALDAFEEIAKSVVYKAPNMPVISPLLGEVVFDSKTINASYMRRATRETVNFVDALAAAQDHGIVDKNTIWVDIGPHPVCSAFIRSCFTEVKATVPSLRRDEDNWSTLAGSLVILHREGVAIDWNEFHRPFESCNRLLNLPSYSWNEKNHWLQYEGDWALTKGLPVNTLNQTLAAPMGIPFKSSTIHQIIYEEFTETSGTVTAQSNLMHPEFFEAANGHRMNNCGVVTSSIHADIAYTLADYLISHFVSGKAKPSMNITNLVVLHGLIANKDTTRDQFIQIEARIDLNTSSAYLQWYNADKNGPSPEHFASATVEYGDTTKWLTEWEPLTHLINSRIESLERMAIEGTANILSKNMAYRLFQNLVDYAEKYRGMQSVILNGYEAVAHVTLTMEKGGNWNVPPYFIDSVAHLAGFIMNGSDASDTKDYFYVTPGWKSLRFAEALVPGGKYRSYVKMMPMEEAGFWAGDVYILRDGKIIGVAGSILFRRFPRTLLTKFFSPPDVKAQLENAEHQTVVHTPASAIQPELTKTPTSTPIAFLASTSTSAPFQPSANTIKLSPSNTATPATASNPAPEPTPSAINPTVLRALTLLSTETSIPISQLTDDVTFTSIGVDSLMSLVLSEKFRSELGVEVKGSLFMECPSVGELREWVEEYC